MKFIFFGYDFSLPVLQRLINDGHELGALYSFECDNIFNFNKDIIKQAQSLNVPVSLAKPTESEIAYYINNEDVQLFLSCGYPYKIPPIDENKAYGVNTHPSLLPKGRGLMPSPHIIMNEPGIAGFTIHKIAPKFDAGDILYQESIPLTPTDTVNTYAQRIATRMPDILSVIVADLPDYWAKAQPQDESRASTAPMPTEETRSFKWTDTIENIDKTGRAFGNFGCLTAINGQKFAIFDYEIIPGPHEYVPETIVHTDETGITIAATNGLVKLKKLTTI